MTEAQPHKPIDDRSGESLPLRLEDTSAGSTHPVPSDASSAADRSAGSSVAAGSRLGDSAGTTTGGFETLLGRLVVRAGLVTAEEIELCKSLALETEETDEPQTLADLLLQHDFLTRRQLDRLRNDFEAKQSSQRIPGYRIKGKLGSGAMATVFLGKQLSLDRDVAIKVLPQRFTDNEKFVERFYKEGRAAAQLNHPNIVGAYDVGKAGDHHYFVMEYVDGQTVFDLIAKRKRLDEHDAIKVIQQVARALQHAHEKGFVHRDIKPKNIMITKAGVVKLADLGLARALADREAAKAEAGRAYGTPYYISPEQIRGEIKIGPSADIYGLGATFYHMVTGRVPFEGKNPSEVMHRHLKSELEPPDHVNPKLGAGCAQVIEMMMAKSPSERYRSAGDLLQDLDLIAEGEPPHFAHRPLDLSDMVNAPAVTASDLPVAVQPTASPSLLESPVLLALAVVAGISVILNIILLVAMIA